MALLIDQFFVTHLHLQSGGKKLCVIFLGYLWKVQKKLKTEIVKCDVCNEGRACLRISSEQVWDEHSRTISLLTLHKSIMTENPICIPDTYFSGRIPPPPHFRSMATARKMDKENSSTGSRRGCKNFSYFWYRYDAYIVICSFRRFIHRHARPGTACEKRASETRCPIAHCRPANFELGGGVLKSSEGTRTCFYAINIQLDQWVNGHACLDGSRI